ncbi:acyltransferase [Limnohabitans sp. DCL3]|uniref:acyltransferase n=1 Tax=Limnohabitans sp. DCL3 TaxID=3374103 RepID=UPI003A89067B
MRNTLRRILNNLRRPMPDLLAYLSDKFWSALWMRSIAKVGRGFHVSSGAKIQGGQFISIGDGFVAGQMLWIEAVQEWAGVQYEPIIEIGKHVTCSQSVHIAANTLVTIGDGVMFGSRIHVTDHGHGVYRGNEQDRPDLRPTLRRLAPGRPVRIERNVWLGDGVMVLPGVKIGEGTIVGANSVVSRDLPSGVIAVGSPAIPIKRYDPITEHWIPIIDSK